MPSFLALKVSVLISAARNEVTKWRKFALATTFDR
jgi:hypothetical protein